MVHVRTQHSNRTSAVCSHMSGLQNMAELAKCGFLSWQNRGRGVYLAEVYEQKRLQRKEAPFENTGT